MNNTELAHRWAQNNGDHGKGSNIFYEDGTIYSYGRHFKIAQHYKGLVLMNSDSYSVSTSKHQSYVRSSVNHLDVIYVPELFGDNTPLQNRNIRHKKNLVYLVGQIDGNIKSLAVARKREIYIEEITRGITALRRYIDVLKAPKTCQNTAVRLYYEHGFEVNEETLQAIKEAKKNAQIKADAKARREAKTWINHRNEKSFHSSDPVFLRLSELSDKVETSQGVNVPIDEARLLFAVVKRSAINGTSLNAEQLNGCGKIGYYNIDRIVKGDITAGCHHIKYKEIADFAERVNW